MNPQILAGLLVAGLMCIPGTVVAPQEPAVQTEKDATDVTLPNELRRICSCESTGSPNNEPRHYDENGNVLRGRINPDDIGKCQINLFYHGERAADLDIDLFTEEGNERFALLLYNEQGSQPWYWSRSCWQ